jgi:hypothetical protein
MAIVTSTYWPKRAPRKKRPRTYPENMPLIAQADEEGSARASDPAE